MRIIGYIEHPSLKITVFQMDNKLSVKFENTFYEQTYKFRQSEDLNTISDVQKLVDETFIAKVLEQFPVMHQTKQKALDRFLPEEEDSFEEII